MILACTILIQYSSVTDGQMDRQTDTQGDDGATKRHEGEVTYPLHHPLDGPEHKLHTAVGSDIMTANVA